jgi:hypothetical protein
LGPDRPLARSPCKKTPRQTNSTVYQTNQTRTNHHPPPVLDREARILGCALLLPLGATPDGARVAELGAFCIDATFRGTGRGDSLLDYVEQVGRSSGCEVA